MSKPTASGVENLSSDCWQTVFNLLGEDDLKAVSLVCKDFLTNSNLVKQNLKVIHPNVSMLSQHLERFTQLKRIDLSDFRGDLDEAIGEIARSEQSLEALHCRPETAFKIKSLERELGLSPKMKSLKTLTFKRIYYLRDKDLMVIANSFPNLEELGFGVCYLGLNWWKSEFSIVRHVIGDQAIEYLASKLKLLKRINLCGTNMNSDQSLLALSVNCPFLKDVTIFNHDGTLTDNGIGLLLRNRPNLEALTIGFISMNSSTITIENSISYVKALTSLNFIGMDISDNLLKEIAKAKLQLRDVGLIECRNFNVSGLLMVTSNYLNNLKLCVSGDNILDADHLRLFLMGDIGNLTHIELDRCRVTNPTFFLLLNRCPSLLEIKIRMARLNRELNNIQLWKKHNIRCIYLRCCMISDEVLKQFAVSFPKLNVLYLDFCHWFTSTGIEVILGSCKFMRKLIIKRGRLNDLKLENRISLEALRLPASNIDDKVLAAVAEKCPRLVYLDLNGCMKQKVSTEGIKRIVENIKSLTCLNVQGCYAVNSGDLLKWMLSTGFFASLKKITLPRKTDATEEQKDDFLRRGCLLL